MWPDLSVLGQPEIFTHGVKTTWIKPPGLNFIHILFIGAGSAGGSGHANLIGGDAGGGGGGGSGAVSHITMPALAVPDALRFEMGVGGLPGGTGATGGTPTASSIIACNTGQTLFTHTVGTSGGGGIGGTAVAGGAGGGLGTGVAQTPWTNAGFALLGVGLAGAAGSLASGTAVTATTIVSGGAGGGGGLGPGAGGTVTSAYGQFVLPNATYPTDPVALTTVQLAAYMTQGIVGFLGGAGGAGKNDGTSGAIGGSGAFGCGGGGGAGVSASVFSGLGGRGGNGIALVWSK